ncbi:MAG: sigma-70 family RNA polymerase sigma factor [Clostridiales bacterium]|nr:sigma-70 family RNA polymerase sigma factor [Clostridiales bacterium]
MKLEVRGAEKLSLREKQVVVYKEMGLPAAEIARRLKMAQSTVATLYSRARAKGYEAVIIIPGEALGLFTEEDEHFGEEEND